MVDPTLGLVKDIIKLGVKLKKALDTIRANDVECQDLQVLVAILIVILFRLQNMGLMSHPAICTAALVCLHGSLDRALKRVTKWQKRNNFHRLLTAGNMAKQLCWVRDDIQNKMLLGNFAFGASIMEITVKLTKTTTTVGYYGAHPPLTQPQLDTAGMDIYSSNSTPGDAGTVEGIDEIITMLTTGTGLSSAPSSGLAEFTLSETVATHHGSEENVNGGSSYTVVSKETVTTLKIQPFCNCSGCSFHTKRRLSKMKGVTDVVIDATTYRAKVTGTMDAAALRAYLRRKLKNSMLVDEPGENAANEYMRPTLFNATEGAQQEPATRLPRARISGGIRAITAKLFRFMRLRPRSNPCQTETAAPSSSPLLIEHTRDTPHLLPGESASLSMTFKEATQQACIHQYQEHAGTSIRLAKASGDLIEKPDLLLLEHQPAASPAMVPARRRRRTFNMSRLHRAARHSRFMQRTQPGLLSSERWGARVLRQLLVPCALCALVLLASVWALH